jgi:hypothetical protein
VEKAKRFTFSIDREASLNERPTLSFDTSVIKGGKECCPRCGGSVFHAEKMMSKNNVS